MGRKGRGGTPKDGAQQLPASTPHVYPIGAMALTGLPVSRRQRSSFQTAHGATLRA